METLQEVLSPEEQNARVVDRYKAFLKRRAEEHAKDDADPERQKGWAAMHAELKKRNEEAGTRTVAVPTIYREE